MRRVGRRAFLRSGLALTGLGLSSGCGVAGWPWQPKARVPRIAYLSVGAVGRGFVMLREGLRELGYIDGETIAIEGRWATSTDELPALAAELVALPVDLIVAATSTAVRASMEATRTIPIVFTTVGDPVGSGFVASLARPGGNVTGLSDQSVQLTQKRLELLRELLPGVSRVVVFADTSIGRVNNFQAYRALQEAAQPLGVQLSRPDIYSAADLDAAFALAISNRAEAIVVDDAPLITNDPERGRIVEFASRARLALMSRNPSIVAAGGLVSYGSGTDALNRRAAVYVDKILKGTPAGDIPVEQATTFDLVVNLKTAELLGVTVPQSVLMQATQVIR